MLREIITNNHYCPVKLLNDRRQVYQTVMTKMIERDKEGERGERGIEREKEGERRRKKEKEGERKREKKREKEKKRKRGGYPSVKL